MTDLESETNPPTEPAAAAVDVPDGHRWETAGEAWGRRAIDWACLFEHYASDVIHAIFRRIGIRDEAKLLDIACGSGLAIRFAQAAGARVAGLDASASLVEVARLRNPEADLRVGTMFALPWPDENFDAVTSINGVWGGCEGALAEACRVLRPGGRIGISFWGLGPPLDLRDCLKAFAVNAPDDHVQGMRRTNNIARPGVAEMMLTSVGFEVVERGGVVSTLEWPDADTAWRAISSIGPAVPALERVGPDLLRPIVLDALDAGRDRVGMYRFRNDHQFVIAEKPEL